MLKLVKLLTKIAVIFFIFFFLINMVEHLFDIEADSYIIVILFIVVVSSTGMFNKKSKW